MSFARLYQAVKNMYHYVQGFAWRIVYGMPDKGMHIYGVTGTNGKTTTCYVLSSILSSEHGKKCVGMLTTVGLRVGEQEIINETKLTTLPSRMVYRYLRDMKHSGVTHVVIEMTSHALDQHRLSGVLLDGAIMLNVQREHLDYHKTIAEYSLAKERIVSYLKKGASFVGKADDERVRLVLDRAREQGISVYGFTSEQARVIDTPLVGEVNKENVLAAVLLARAAGISQRVIDVGAASVKGVPGRMEWVQGKGGVRILIDYAVTPDALDRLYRYIKSETSGKVLALLGAAGLRDRGKRPDMSRNVAKYADVLVLTREDPWTEPEEQIFSDLEQGLDDTVGYKRILDRRDAIRYLLEKAQSGDVVVVTGKGAERGMAVGAKVIPWNDREVIEEIVENLS